MIKRELIECDVLEYLSQNNGSYPQALFNYIFYEKKRKSLTKKEITKTITSSRAFIKKDGKFYVNEGWIALVLPATKDLNNSMFRYNNYNLGEQYILP